MGSVILYLNNVDWRLLREQKADLLSRITDDDALMGLVHLLDEIQDQAATRLGEATVFGAEVDA